MIYQRGGRYLVHTPKTGLAWIYTQRGDSCTGTMPFEEAAKPEPREWLPVGYDRPLPPGLMRRLVIPYRPRKR